MKVTQKDELKKTNITLFDEKERKHKNAVIKSIFVFITQTERKKSGGWGKNCDKKPVVIQKEN